MNPEQTIQKIQRYIKAYLFWAAEPIQKPVLQKHIEQYMVSLGEWAGEDFATIFEQAIVAMKQRLLESAEKHGSTVLVVTDNTLELRLAPQVAGLISQVEKDTETRDIGKAGMETLAIILYENGATKRRIEYIRGINAQFTLRNLLTRGLIAKSEKNGERGVIYIPTTETLAFLGITSIDQLPNYGELVSRLKDVEVQPNPAEKVQQ